jgi:hypothetical protein
VIFTRIAMLMGLALVGAMCWLAASGFAPVYPFLVTAVVMILLVGGGNLIQGRTPPHGGHARTAPSEPEGSQPENPA